MRKLFCLICTIALTLSLHVSVYAQGRVSLNCENTSLKEVMEVITKQTSLSFAFTNNIDADNIKVNATVNNATVENALKEILEPLGISFRISGKQIILNPVNKTQAASSKQISVSGAITTEDGEPLPGVVVLDLNTNKFVVADVDGNYTINAAPDTKLQFTALGMQNVELAVKGKAILNVVMPTDVLQLDDVIVTGYQTISKERSAASYNVVQGEAVKSSAMSRGSILESLEGTSAGLTIDFRPTSGYKYMVRGLTSINSSMEPLFVLDGVPVGAENVENLLSANDIQSVTVLKDATAVSIWGSRAANGVVVITSKSGGNTNGKISVSYDGSFTMKGKPSMDSYNMMDNETFMKNALEVFMMPEYQTAYSWDIVSKTANGLASLTTYNTPMILPHEQILYDWQRGLISESERDSKLNALAQNDGYGQIRDLFTVNTWNTSHNISVSGGTGKFKVFGSMGYDGRQSNFQTTNDNYKVNLKQQYQIAKWLSWDLTVNASLSKGKEYYEQNFGSSNAYLTTLPYALLQNPDGSWIDYNQYRISPTWLGKIEPELGISTVYHPVEDFKSSVTKTNSIRVRANTGLTVKLIKGLTYEARFQYLKGSTDTEFYIPEDSWYIRNLRILGTAYSTNKQMFPAKGGDLTVTESKQAEYTIRHQLNYNNSFDDNKHQITALAGTEWRESSTNNSKSFVKGYDYQTMSQTLYDITNSRNAFLNYYGGATYPTVDHFANGEQKLRYVSYYGNVAYTAFKKYTLNGSVRIDQSNLFGTDVNSQYKPIGSVGAAWRISEEDFISKVNWIDNLTLRASWGLSGNSPLPTMGGPYDIITPTTHTSFQGESGYKISSPSNKKICWEKTRTWNVGLDFAVLKHRLNGSIDLYHKNTTDLLANKPLNVLTGYSQIFANVGSLENKGIELSLHSTNINTKDFRWNTDFNLSLNKNKVKDYYKSPAQTVQDKIFYGSNTEGYPAGALWGFSWAGLRHEDGVPQVYDKDGNLKYNYLEMTVDDVKYIGTAIPKYSGSLSNRLTYRDFELSALIIFNLGYKMATHNTNLQLSGRFDKNRTTEFDQRWRQPGDEEFTNIPSAFEDPSSTGRNLWYSSYLYAYSDVAYESANYLKLRELTLSYNLPASLCKKLSVGNAQVRVSAHDVFKVVANSKGLDPEVGLYGENYGANYSIGLSINF